MYLKFFTISTLLFSASTFAKPVYLECEIIADKEKQNFTVKVDEDSGKVTHTFSVGYAFKSEAFFTPDKISYSETKTNYGVKIVRTFDISRINLNVTQTSEISSTKFPDKVPVKTLVSNGECNIVDVEGRNF